MSDSVGAAIDLRGIRPYTLRPYHIPLFVTAARQLAAFDTAGNVCFKQLCTSCSLTCP